MWTYHTEYLGYRECSPFYLIGSPLFLGLENPDPVIATEKATLPNNMTRSLTKILKI